MYVFKAPRRTGFLTLELWVRVRYRTAIFFFFFLIVIMELGGKSAFVASAYDQTSFAHRMSRV